MVSIIIVNWNGKKWLPKCLGSLSLQTFDDFEIVLVDNASSDDSLDYVRKVHPEVRLIESDRNLGFAGGNNLGIANAKGELILLLNSDTWVEPDFLERLVMSFRKNPVDVIAPQGAGYDDSRRSASVPTIDPTGFPIYLPHEDDKAGKLFYLGGVCLLFRRDLYEETGGLDEDFFMYCEETDWFWRLHLLKKTIRHDDETFVHHYGAGSTGKGLRDDIFLWRNQNNLQMLLKNYQSFNLLWALPLYFLQNLVEVFFFLLIFRPGIAWTYIQGWKFNVVNLERTLRKRRVIQRSRKVGDREIIRKMYCGSSKLRHLARAAGLS